METLEEKARRIFETIFNLRPCTETAVVAVLVSAFQEIETEARGKVETVDASLNIVHSETEVAV